MNRSGWLACFRHFGFEFLEKRSSIPLYAAPGTIKFNALRIRCAPDELGHESLFLLAFRNMLLYLYSENFCGVHLLVQELYDTPQFGRDLVRDEDQTHLACLQVGCGSLPEVLRVEFEAKRSEQFCFRLVALCFAICLEGGAQPFERSVHDPIGRIVERLGHDFTPSASIRASLDFYYRGDRVLIQKQVVCRPPVAAAFLEWHPHHTRD